MKQFTLLVFCLITLLAGCQSTSTQTDSGIDANDGQANDAGDQINDAGDQNNDAGDSASDPGQDAGDQGSCTFSGAYGDDCTRDCDCKNEFACRGNAGQQTCLVACQSYDGCTNNPTGCASYYCDMNIGACVCNCQTGDCDPQVCVSGICIDCGWDGDCAEFDCSGDPDLPDPLCQPDIQACVCSGKCGNGNCDSYEEAVNSCPADCSGPCVDGEILSFSCTNLQTVQWCVCTNSSWECDDPLPKCPGENQCIAQGGMCVDSVDSCYEGEIAAEANGCVAPSPLCCQPINCTGAGVSYYPGMGYCCPGLRAIPSRSMMTGMIPDAPEAISCCDSCWALLCAPCGDQVCQTYMGENFCTCPEDCPEPPYELSCHQSANDCGVGFCRQDGEVCHQETPNCNAGDCSWTTQDLSGQICNPVTRACQ